MQNGFVNVCVVCYTTRTTRLNKGSIFFQHRSNEEENDGDDDDDDDGITWNRYRQQNRLTTIQPSRIFNRKIKHLNDYGLERTHLLIIVDLRILYYTRTYSIWMDGCVGGVPVLCNAYVWVYVKVLCI